MLKVRYCDDFQGDEWMSFEADHAPLVGDEVWVEMPRYPIHLQHLIRHDGLYTVTGRRWSVAGDTVLIRLGDRRSE